MKLRNAVIGVGLFTLGYIHGHNNYDAREEHYAAFKDVIVDSTQSYHRPAFLEVAVDRNTTVLRDWETGKELVVPPNMQLPECDCYNLKDAFNEGIDFLDTKKDNLVQKVKEWF